MPAILSKQITDKLLGSEWSFGYNCYEVGHTWTPSCTDAALEVSIAAGARVLPLYALLYGFGQVAVQRRFDLAASWQTLESTIRSTSFIAFHLYNGSLVGCALRNGFGRFYYRVLVCIPALISAYSSLLIEKPVRRQALAFYVLNLASEVAYRTAVSKGYVKPIRHGETLIFALSLATWYRLIRRHGFGHDPVSGMVKFLIGRDEAKSRAKTITKEYNGKQCGEANKTSKLSRVEMLLPNWLCGRHTSCPHNHPTCFRYVVGPIPSRFFIGCVVQAMLRMSSKPLELIKDPRKTMLDAFVSKSTFRFGMFVASLVSCGRFTNCLLRRYSNSNSCDWHALISGFVAGCSMLWSPKSSISMYIMWKAIEQHYLILAKEGKIPCFNFSIMTIYSFSAATLLYTFALEPGLMRPSYMKFLDNLSDHRLHQLNRMVLDVFGTGASVGYEDYFPDLDPKLMSNQFKELIFNWMIQPYE